MGIREDFNEIRVQTAALDVEVRRLLAYVESESGTMARTHKAIFDLLSKHEKRIYGNDKPGLVTQVDRLEQVEKSRRINLRIMWGAILTTAGALVVKILGR